MVDKTGNVQQAQVDVRKTKVKKEETTSPRPVVDMTGGMKPVSQNPLDFIEEITGKKPMDNPQMKAMQQHLYEAVEAENAKKAQMTPEQRAAYEQEQDEKLLAGITERRERAENERTALGRYVQGWKDDFAPVRDAKGVAGKVSAAAGAVVDRTRQGFGSIDTVIGLPQGTTEKVWAGAALWAIRGALATSTKGATALSTARTLLANPGTKAVATVGGLAGSAALASCSGDFFDEDYTTIVQIPQDTVVDTKPIVLPPETLTYIVHDTLIERDTLREYIKVPEYIHETDTLWRTDTIEHYIEVPKVVHDTTTLIIPGPTVEVPEEWESPIPDKQKEIFDMLGIDIDKNGKFVLSTSYKDEYQTSLDMRVINGGKSARDGSVIVYDEIKTGWNDSDNKEMRGFILGKNETYRRYEYSLSDDGKNLTIVKFKPVSNFTLSNEDGKPNWDVFKNQLNDADAWTYDGIMTLSIEDGKVRVIGTSSGGDGELSKGDIENSVMYTNPYEGQWRLTDWDVQTGDDNYHKDEE